MPDRVKNLMKKKSENNKSAPVKIFIGGHRKCGTTLFLNLLDNHPQLSVYPHDLYIFYAYYPKYCSDEYDSKERSKRLNQIFNYVENLYVRKGWNKRVSFASIRDNFFKHIKEKNLSNIHHVLDILIRSFFQEYYDKKISQLEVVKETSIEIYADSLLSNFPNSKFIHIIRDPRDNYAALRGGLKSRYADYQDDANTILNSMIHRYGLGMKLAEINRKSWGEDRYLVVKHEDTVTDCLKQMKRVSEFLEIEFSETLLAPTVLGGPTRGNNFENLDMSKVNQTNIARWPKRIDEEEAMIIEFYFGDLMKKYKYDCAFKISDQVKAVSRFYEWSNYKYYYFDHFSSY